MAQNTRNNVLIVGGSSGVGLAVAKLALSHLPGTNIIISSTSETKLQDAVKEIKAAAKSADPIIDYVVGNVARFETQFDDVEAILKQSVAKFGSKIDHIVWTAGTRPVYSAGEQELQRNNNDVIEVAAPRLFGPLVLQRIGKDYIADSTHSSITITSGSRIYKPVPGSARLLGAAGGMEMASRGLALDLAPIRSNVVVLGAIQTPMLDGLVQRNEAAAKRMADVTLCKRIGTAEEAAEAYLYCMRCSYVTGSRVDVEGGALLC